MVSGYQAAHGERLERTPHPFLRGIFRAAFGGPRSRPEFRTSFFPTLMDAHFWTCWDQPPGDDRDLGVPVYRTFIFGATIDLTYPERRAITARHVAQQKREALSPEDEARVRREATARNQSFMQAQCGAVERLIASEYAGLGFRTTVEPAEAKSSRS